MTKDHSDLADVIVGLINHARINGHRLSPLFGQQQGDLAVRVASLEAALEARPHTPETGRQRFEELTEGQDPATVWRDRAFKLAEELDSASLHHLTGERITRKDLNNAFRQGRENGRLAAHALDGILSAATSKVVEQAREIRRMIDEGCDVRSNAVMGAMDDIIAALASAPTALPEGHIPVPRNADEAVAMWLLGENWVRSNAPDRLRHPEPAAPSAHPDDTAVDRFAVAMKAKLAKKRAEGRGGWEDKANCSQDFLSRLLRGHVEKGDPVDVANLCMMLHQRGERIG